MSGNSDRCLRVLEFEAGVNSVAWSPDGTRLAIGEGGGGVEVLTAEGRRLWRNAKVKGDVRCVSWSFGGSRLVVAFVNKPVEVYETASGQLLLRCDQLSQPWPVACSPKGVLFATRTNRSIKCIDIRTGEELSTLDGHDTNVWSLAWSPDGTRLASGSSDKSFRIWDPKQGCCLECIEGHEGDVNSLTWSPDGQRIASGSDDQSVRIWDPETGRCLIQCIGHQDRVWGVAWSPEGNLLASASSDNSIRLWDPDTGRQLHHLEGHTSPAYSVAFSPDATRLASASNDKTVRIWDVSDLIPARARRTRSSTFEAYVTRQAASVGRRAGKPDAPPTPLPPDLRPLPAALAHLTRLGLAAPCSHVRTLLRLTAGAPDPHESATPLASHPGLRRLADLRWPVRSRLGLVALLLHTLPKSPTWTPPPEATPTALEDALTAALAGEPRTPEAPPLPVAALTPAADAVDERLLTLLELVGPDAVAADPGLPLRLLPRVSKLPPLAASRRRLLGLRLRLDRGGPAHGHGGGAERTGIDVRGDWRAILPWQLALPEDVLRGRYLRNEILYRARSGEEPPRLRPTVLVLDVSPPTFGPVERATRLAAHVVASTLLEAGLPVVLVTAGGRPTVRTLERRSDLVDLWTLRSLKGADEAVTVRVARAMRETLAGEELSPVVVLLSHVFFGADEDVEDVPGLRGLFVQYPGQTVRPPMAEACERWESVGAGEVEGLEERLGRLVG